MVAYHVEHVEDERFVGALDTDDIPMTHEEKVINVTGDTLTCHWPDFSG